MNENTFKALDLAKRDLKADLDAEHRSSNPNPVKIEELKVQIGALEERRTNLEAMDANDKRIAAAPKFDMPVADKRSEHEFGSFLQASVGVGQRSVADFYEARAQSIASGSGGGYLVPDALSADIWESVTNEAVLVSKAGVRVEYFSEASAMNIARVDATASPSWRAEGATVTEDAIELGIVRATPQSLAVMVKSSWEVLADSAGAIERLVAAEVSRQFALAIDSAIYEGTGAGNQPVGILNWDGIGTTGSVGAITEADIATAALDILGNNHTPNAAIMGYREYKVLTEQRADAVSAADKAGSRLAKSPFLDGVTYLPTNQIADSGTTTALVGDFSQAVLAVRQQLSVLPLKELYAANGQVAWVFHARADVVVLRPGAFHSLTGVTA